jgi:dihydroflavonol-4-reductase
MEMNHRKIYIVTGAGGHLGGQVVRRLLAEGKAVRAFLLPGEGCPAEEKNAAGQLTEVYGDVCEAASIEPLFAGGEGCVFCVIHCAGLISIATRGEERVFRVNVGGTANMVAACKKHGARLLYVSSVHALPELPQGQMQTEVGRFEPAVLTGGYARTKAAASQIVLDAVRGGLDALIVHPAGIIGPGGRESGNMTNMISLYLRGRLPAAVQGGFDFVDVRDVAAGIIAAVDKGRTGECYILGNRFIPLREFFETLAEVSGGRKLRLYLPIRLAQVFAPFQEIGCRLLHKPMLFTGYSLYTLSQNSLYSSEKARRDLGYTTRDLKETLRDTVDWVRRGLPKRRRALGTGGV